MTARIRRQTAREWRKDNPILGVDEPGIDTTVDKIKYGDGKTRWKDLQYAATSGGSTDSGTSGGSGVTARGAYDATASYVKGDLVSDAYNLWLAVADTIAPGSTLTTLNPIPGWSSSAGATAFPYADVASNFTPSEALTFTEFEYYHSGGTIGAGTVGFAAAITIGTVTPAWVSPDSHVTVAAQGATAAGWRKITLPSPITLAAGTTYSLAFHGGAGINVAYWGTAEAGVKMAMGSLSYNTSATSGPNYSTQSASLRLGFRLLVTLAPLPWARVTPLSGLKQNNTGTAIVPADYLDSFIIGSDQIDHDSTNTNKYTRFWFDKTLGAMGGGRFSYSTSRGTNSFAYGASSQAGGLAAVAMGHECQATNSSSVALGYQANSSGVGSFSAGQNNYAVGTASRANGAFTRAEAEASSTDGHYSLGQRFSQRSLASGRFASWGDAQTSDWVQRGITTNATPAVITSGGIASIVLTGATINVLTILAKRAYQLKISTVARRTDVQGEAASWTWEGLVNRDATGSAYIIGTPIIAAWGAAGAAAWDLSVSINTLDVTHNYIAIMVTGEVGKTIRWVSKLEWTEVVD